MRAHTAKCVQRWCADPRTGKIRVTNAKVLGAVIWSQIKPVSHPIKTEYTGLDHPLEVELAAYYDEGKHLDWRRWTMHIDRPGMKRIDRWVNDLFMLIMYQHYVGTGRVNKTETIRHYLEMMDINENDLMFTSVYDSFRRIEREEKNDRWPLMNSLS